MQVIFTKKHAKGNIGDIKTVADGFAKNSLIPQGIAIQATPENIRALKRQQEKDILEAKTKEQNTKDLIEKIQSFELIIEKQSTPMSKPIGSITHAEISAEFEKLSGIKIDKKDIKSEKISEFGGHKIKVAVGLGLFAYINLFVKPI